jgi:hypothetical protein
MFFIIESSTFFCIVSPLNNFVVWMWFLLLLGGDEYSWPVVSSIAF